MGKKSKKEATTTTTAATAATATTTDAVTDAPTETTTAPLDAVVAADAPTTKATEETNALPKEEVWTLKVILPHGSEPLTIEVRPTDTAQEIRSFVAELASMYYVTCFALEHKNKRINEYTPLSGIAGMQSGSVITVIEDTYTLRTVRAHVRRFRELLELGFPDQLWAPNNITGEHITPSLVGHITRSVKSEGDAVDPELETLRSEPLSTIYRPILTNQPIECLRSISFNAFNPPTASRAMYGDLAYLTAVTLENKTINITAHSNGFFVNRSTEACFDPQEHATQHVHAHDLVTLFRHVSPKFADQFKKLQKSLSDRHLFELLASHSRVTNWLVPQLPVRANHGRADDSHLNTFDADITAAGNVRDWNDEFQSIREMPVETRTERLRRDMALFRFQTDFVNMAVRGAQTIVHGNVPTLDPTDDSSDLRMFLWNNIFFSFAVNARDNYKLQGGDAAAHASAGQDIHGISAYIGAAVPGLCTLATAVIDYAGRRVVAQALVPGIFKRDPAGPSITHGSLDNGKTIARNDKLDELLAKAAELLHIKPHSLKSENGDVVKLSSSAECKGMCGTDGRLYIIDLFRTTPHDPNFLYEPGSTTVRHGVYTLRSELVESYYEHEAIKNIRAKIREKQAEEAQAQERKAKEAGEDKESKPAEGAIEAAPTTTDGAAAGEGAGAGAVEGAAGEGAGAVEGAAAGAGETKSTEEEGLSLADCQAPPFNPDVFTIFSLADDEATIESDKQLVKHMGDFLVLSVIPKLFLDLARGVVQVYDGVDLTDQMHARGINMRYLGKLAELADSKHAPAFLKKLFVMEMLSRAAKHILRELLNAIPFHWSSVAIAHFLNCYLGNVTGPVDWAKFAAGRGYTLKKKAASVPTQISSMTSASVWENLQAVVKLHFSYDLPDRKTLATLIKTKLPLLRSICRKTGVQLHPQNFPLESASPFSPADVAGLVPLSKSVSTTSWDALALTDYAQRAITSNTEQEQALAAFDEASSLLTQVHSHLHPAVATSLRTLASILSQVSDIPAAASVMERCTISYERSLGFDHPEVIRSIIHLANFFNIMGRRSLALTLLHHARRLVQLVFGDDHPDMLRIEQTMALVMLQAGKGEPALALLKTTVKGHEHELDMPSVHELMAAAAMEAKDPRAALQYQRMSYTELSKMLAPNSPRLKASADRLSVYTAEAVKSEKAKRKEGSVQFTALNKHKGKSGRHGRVKASSPENDSANDATTTAAAAVDVAETDAKVKATKKKHKAKSANSKKQTV